MNKYMKKDDTVMIIENLVKQGFQNKEVKE